MRIKAAKIMWSTASGSLLHSVAADSGSFSSDCFESEDVNQPGMHCCLRAVSRAAGSDCDSAPSAKTSPSFFLLLQPPHSAVGACPMALTPN